MQYNNSINWNYGTNEANPVNHHSALLKSFPQIHRYTKKMTHRESSICFAHTKLCRIEPDPAQGTHV